MSDLHQELKDLIDRGVLDSAQAERLRPHRQKYDDSMKSLFEQMKLPALTPSVMVPLMAAAIQNQHRYSVELQIELSKNRR